MKFDELDAKMRVFETANDRCVLPGIFMVARIDGRNFTRLTKDVHQFDAPFDEKFRDMMVKTTKHLMNCGFRIIYGYTQSDEISLVFHRAENAFGRKLRKLDSVLAGEASAKFSLLLGDLAAFDCRISQLPAESDLIDYLRWRNEDAHRNALNAHCYWTLRRKGMTVEQATNELSGCSVAEKTNCFSPSQKSISTICQIGKSGASACIGRITKKSVATNSPVKMSVHCEDASALISNCL